MLMKRDEVVSKFHEHNQELSEHYGIASLFLFGSVTRDEDAGQRQCPQFHGLLDQLFILLCPHVVMSKQKAPSNWKALHHYLVLQYQRPELKTAGSAKSPCGAVHDQRERRH
jgi:hypothetical protein